MSSGPGNLTWQAIAGIRHERAFDSGGFEAGLRHFRVVVEKNVLKMI
jgi:hypothetical protein